MLSAVRRRDVGTRPFASLTLLALYGLLGIAAPVAHAQLEAGRRATTHVEAQSVPCEAHDELSCSTCRIASPVVPVASAVLSLTAVPCVFTSNAVPADQLVHRFTAAPLGARAPPLL
jgi:hypothetical protein